MDVKACPRPSLLVVGLDPIGVEVALALAEAGQCHVTIADDTIATAAWREAASHLLLDCHRCLGGTMAGAVTTRSEFLAAVLTSLGKENVRALSPTGGASVVAQFEAVVMADPTLPHAIAFNEHVSSHRALNEGLTSFLP